MNDFFTGDHFNAAGDCAFSHHKTTDIFYGNNQFIIDDLLVDFPNHDDVVLNDEFFVNVVGNSADSSTVTAVESCNSWVAGNVRSCSFSDSQFSGVELCLPYDDVAELEWLSTITHESSFSTADIQNLQLISAANKSQSPATATSSSVTTPAFHHHQPPPPYRLNSQISQTAVFVPSKPRTKRSRTAPYNWSSRILNLKPSIKTTPFERREILEPSVTRSCLHCGSEKTPQWRTGPMGPKTLCNACGVRFKSGRLVPEYRPAASPTFVSAKHSNSHRKVMEIRRQKEIRNNNGFGNWGSGLVDDCLIERKGGSGFMHMM